MYDCAAALVTTMFYFTPIMLCAAILTPQAFKMNAALLLTAGLAVFMVMWRVALLFDSARYYQAPATLLTILSLPGALVIGAVASRLLSFLPKRLHVRSGFIALALISTITVISMVKLAYLVRGNELTTMAETLKKRNAAPGMIHDFSRDGGRLAFLMGNGWRCALSGPDGIDPNSWNAVFDFIDSTPLAENDRIMIRRPASEPVDVFEHALRTAYRIFPFEQEAECVIGHNRLQLYRYTGELTLGSRPVRMPGTGEVLIPNSGVIDIASLLASDKNTTPLIPTFENLDRGVIDNGRLTITGLRTGKGFSMVIRNRQLFPVERIEFVRDGNDWRISGTASAFVAAKTVDDPADAPINTEILRPADLGNEIEVLLLNDSRLQRKSLAAGLERDLKKIGIKAKVTEPLPPDDEYFLCYSYAMNSTGSRSHAPTTLFGGSEPDFNTFLKRVGLADHKFDLIVVNFGMQDLLGASHLLPWPPLAEPIGAFAKKLFANIAKDHPGAALLVTLPPATYPLPGGPRRPDIFGSAELERARTPFNAMIAQAARPYANLILPMAGFDAEDYVPQTTESNDQYYFPPYELSAHGVDKQAKKLAEAIKALKTAGGTDK